MMEPEIEGSDVYLAVRLDSPWGLSTLAMAESITLKVNGVPVSGDPIETAVGDTVRVTWTWTGAAGGVETINVEVELEFQPGQPSLRGSTTYEIETFDTGGGTGTYYPPDEPLRTDGGGSTMMLEITMELQSQDGGLMLERITTITIHDEMAFWMRWGMDHIGDENPALSQTLRAFSAGAVSDEDRISRFIEDVERSEFERQMVSLGPMYMNTGLGLDTEELLGDFRAFNELRVEVDLNGQDAVINHPVTLRFSTTELVEDGSRIDLLRNFIVVQPAPLWSDYSLDLTARSSALTALSNSIIRESDAFDFAVLRMPWGDIITMEGEGIEQGEKFSFEVLPTSSLAYAVDPHGAHVGGVAGSLCHWLAADAEPTTHLPLSRIGLDSHRCGGHGHWLSGGLHRYRLGRCCTHLGHHRHGESSLGRCTPAFSDTAVSSDSLSCLSNSQRRHNGRSSSSLQLCWVRACHQVGCMIRGSALSGWPPFEPLLDSHLGRNNPQTHRFHPPPQRLAGFAGGCQRAHLSDCPRG